MPESEDSLYDDVQRRLIASLIASSEDVAHVLETVDQSDFAEPEFEIIFATIVEIVRSNETVSVVSVAEYLEATGALNKIGGTAELYNLRNLGFKYLHDAPASVYARIVCELSVRNQTADKMQTHMHDLSFDSGQSAADTIASLQSDLNTMLFKLSNDETVHTMSDLAEHYIDSINDRAEISRQNMESAGGLQGIPSLISALNEDTSGWQNGQFITVAAQTGIGKSIFAINCTVAAAQANKSIRYFSLEMSRSEIENRIVSSVTGIPTTQLQQGTATDYESLHSGLEKLRTMKITIDTEPKLTVDSIRARCLQQAQSDEGLDMVVVDYLQLLTATKKTSNRQEAVADISRNVKLLAKDLDVPVIVVAQLVRPTKDQQDMTPTQNDIRESGAIANDSDIVVLLHREESHDGAIPHTKVILEKNRGGPSGRVYLCHSNLACSIFREVVTKENTRVTEDELHELETEFELDDEVEL